MSNVSVYSFADVNGLTKYVDSEGDFNFTGTWSNTGTYFASTLDAVYYGASTTLYMCIRDNVGDNPRRTPTRARPTSWSIMSLLYEYQASGSISPETVAALAQAAWNLAQIGTNTGTAAYDLAGSAYALAGSASVIASSALTVASGAFAIAVTGTNAAATAQAQADSAYALAQIGTNTGTAALAAAAGAQATADAAFLVAVNGTNSAATAQSRADAAYLLAEIGTNTGTAALAAAAGAQATADAAFLVAVAGTNAAAAAASVADSAWALAQVGTNTGTAALAAAAGAQATADAAFSIAVIGTNAAAAAASVASSAWSLAQVGTNTGTAALAAAAGAQATADAAFLVAVAGTNAAAAAASVADSAWALAQLGTVIPPLSALPDVSIPAPFVSQVLTFDGSRWTAATPSSTPSAGVGFTYYLDGTSTELPGYEQLLTVPEVGTEYVENAAVTSAGSVLIDQYVSGTFGRTNLDGGVWVYHTFASATGTSACSIKVQTSILSGSTETDLWSITTPYLTPSATGYLVEIFGAPLTVDTDDRLLLRYYGIHDGAGTEILTLYHGGTIHQTHVDTPFALLHNSLAGLQGGTTDQFYHVTEVESDALNAAISPSGTNPFVTSSDSRLLDAQIALSTANSALALAQIGTNTGTAALAAAAGAQATADAAFSIAVIGTNAAAAAQSTANSAFNVAVAGTAAIPYAVTTVTAGTVNVPTLPARKLYLVDSSSGSVTILLPNTLGWSGQVIHIKKISTEDNSVTTRSVTGTQTVDGLLEQSFSYPYTSVQVTTDGTHWYIV